MPHCSTRRPAHTCVVMSWKLLNVQYAHDCKCVSARSATLLMVSALACPGPATPHAQHAQHAQQACVHHPAAIGEHVCQGGVPTAPNSVIIEPPPVLDTEASAIPYSLAAART